MEPTSQPPWSLRGAFSIPTSNTRRKTRRAASGGSRICLPAARLSCQRPALAGTSQPRHSRLLPALDPARSCGDDHRVRFSRQPQAYTRTCAQCGSTWHVPTSARQWRSRLVNRFLAEFVTIAGAALGGDPDTVARRAESISERNRQAKTSRHCPNCGADHFTQRVSRRELPY